MIVVPFRNRDVENCSPAELGARTVEILDAAYRSAASGQLEHVQHSVRTSQESS